MTKRRLPGVFALLMLVVLAFGSTACMCKKKVDCTSCATAQVLCGNCGEIKGSATCCSADVAICKDCGLHKGSPGCCKITKGEDATLCPNCGEIKGSENCCKVDAAKCPKCGLNKGSPGCCKAPAKASAACASCGSPDCTGCDK